MTDIAEKIAALDDEATEAENSFTPLEVDPLTILELIAHIRALEEDRDKMIAVPIVTLREVEQTLRIYRRDVPLGYQPAMMAEVAERLSDALDALLREAAQPEPSGCPACGRAFEDAPGGPCGAFHAMQPEQTRSGRGHERMGT
jgi:hypothetical protein